MKNVFLSIITVLFIGMLSGNAQNALPNVTLKTLDGKTLNTSDLPKDKPVIISFWATWCVNCIKELDAISEVYEDWQDETDVELFAVTIDDSRALKRVKPMVNGKGWDYDILLDTNQELKRALGISTIPVTLVVKNGKIIHRHSNYTPGAEDKLFEEVKELSK